MRPPKEIAAMAAVTETIAREVAPANTVRAIEEAGHSRLREQRAKKRRQRRKAQRR